MPVRRSLALRHYAGVLTLLASIISRFVARGHTYGPKVYRRDRAIVWENALPADLVLEMKKDAWAVNEWENEFGTLKNYKKRTRWFPRGARPRNALEEAIVRLEQFVRPGASPFQYTGAEWWVQAVTKDPSDHEPIGFHVDKDEAIASNEHYLLHPEWSSVFYLTESGGCTLILDQWSPNGNGYDPVEAKEGELVCPHVNRYVIFDGDLLHGVLPGRKEHIQPGEERRVTFLVNWWFQQPKLPNCDLLPHRKVKGLKYLSNKKLKRLRKRLKDNVDALTDEGRKQQKRKRVQPDVIPLQRGHPDRVSSYNFNFRLPGGRISSVDLPKHVSKSAVYTLKFQDGGGYAPHRQVHTEL